MSCSTDEPRTILRGSTEYLKATLTSDVTLDGQTVEFSVDDGTTWLPATAVGPPGTTRTYQHLLLPASQPTPGVMVEVLVRITDNPEIPIIDSGSLLII